MREIKGRLKWAMMHAATLGMALGHPGMVHINNVPTQPNPNSTSITVLDVIPPQPNIGITNNSSPSEQLIIQGYIDQIRPVGNWETYQYMGKPSVSEDVFVNYLVSHGSPSASVAKKIYADAVAKGIDPGPFLGIYQAESGLQGMNECNLRYAPDAPTIRGFARYEQFGEEGYVMAANDCFNNLIRWHERGVTNFMDLLRILTPVSDGNNTPQYIVTVFTVMDTNNENSIEEYPPIPLKRRAIIYTPGDVSESGNVRFLTPIAEVGFAA